MPAVPVPAGQANGLEGPQPVAVARYHVLI